MKNSWPGDDVLKGTGINLETFLALTMSLEFILKILKYERSLEKWVSKLFCWSHCQLFHYSLSLMKQYQKQKQRGQSTWKKNRYHREIKTNTSSSWVDSKRNRERKEASINQNTGKIWRVSNWVGKWVIQHKKDSQISQNKSKTIMYGEVNALSFINYFH